MSKTQRSINIKDFILNSFTEAKPTASLEIIFGNEHVQPTEGNGQQKSEGLLYPFASSQLFDVPIKQSKILVESNVDESNTKNVMEITLNIESLEIQWQPGDTIAILPSNSEKDVQMLLHYLDLTNEADLKCQLRVNPSSAKKTAKVPMHIPAETTAREILQDCINIKGVLKKQFLSSLADYCTDNDEKSFLKCLSSKEATLHYNELIITKGFTLIDILELCPSCRPSLNLIVEHLPRLLPRPYSIANSYTDQSKEITIIFSILNDKPGVTTNMLLKKAQEDTASILMYLREPNTFRYTEEDYSKNQILIAIGTGLAPFLGILQHKQHLEEQKVGEPAGQTWLFVGATTEKAILHREQLVEWESKNILNKFVEAYSRCPLASDRKYVQDSLMLYSHEVFELLKQTETILYLCADGGEISNSIETCLTNIIQKESLVSNEEAHKILKEYKAKGKYRVDLWL